MVLVEEVKLPPADRGYIYFAEITLDGEKFTKVGYSQNPNRRFTYDLSEFEHNEVYISFKNIIPMMDWMYEHAEYTPDATYWEKLMHSVMRKAGIQYTPSEEFSGSTECYRLTPQEYKAAIDYLEEQLSMMAPPKDWYIPYNLEQ
ncbi:GIY-YIG nuclease family protein [Aeromonas veronii]|uniref:GIY-YIG nuclease family protein n=1 Tax=Aeromonas veronii TaxID=654 RepID=UPI003B9E7F0B